MALITLPHLISTPFLLGTTASNTKLVVRPNASNKFQLFQAKLLEAGFNHFRKSDIASIFNTIKELKQNSSPTDRKRNFRVAPGTRCETHVTIGIGSLRVYIQKSPVINQGGSKAFSHVYCVEMTHGTEEAMSIDEVGKLSSCAPQFVPYIVKELELTETFNHPNIHTHIEFHQYINEAKEAVVVAYTPICDTSPTASSSGPVLQIASALLFLKSILSALIYLHDRKIVHNDIKLDNILMFRSSGRLFQYKLTDFGLANQMFPDFTENTPPELFNKKLDVNNPTFLFKGDFPMDMWALGCQGVGH